MPKISGISPLFDYGATNKNNSYVREINFADDQNFFARIGKNGFLETKGSTIDRILKNDFLGEKRLTYLGLSNFGIISERMLKKSKET
ncbi:MAG: hypothetical protein CM15mP127_13710 [Gammaproteobacteria bacterium]|nr:MAG: hypothetical protein CM15mP127_13710 [Gammaproteobacteria bacterium]